MRWREICDSNHYAGQWVALDNVRYDPHSSQPVEAEVVDADEDLGDLCARMREADRSSCAILFCEEDAQSEPVAARAVAPTRRAAQP